MGEARLKQHSEQRLRETRIRALRWKVYEYAATACAIHLGRIVPIGDIDLDDDYRMLKLEEIGQALKLQKTTALVPAPACLAMNFAVLAQVKIGRPRNHFAGESMAEILVPADPIGANLLDRHWPQIERVAEALVLKGRLAEAEVLQILTARFGFS
jgi:hypothetical protein